MTLTGLLILLVIAAICGILGQAIAGAGRGGLLVAIVLGFIGALIGTWLASALHLPELLVIDVEGHPFPVLWAIIGAALFVGFLSLFTRPRVVTTV